MAVFYFQTVVLEPDWKIGSNFQPTGSSWHFEKQRLANWSDSVTDFNGCLKRHDSCWCPQLSRSIMDHCAGLPAPSSACPLPRQPRFVPECSRVMTEGLPFTKCYQNILSSFSFSVLRVPNMSGISGLVFSKKTFFGMRLFLFRWGSWRDWLN